MANNGKTQLAAEQCVVDFETSPCELYISPVTEELVIPENPKLFDDEWRKLHFYSDKNSQYEALYSETLSLFSRYEQSKAGLSGDDHLKEEITAQCVKILKAIDDNRVINSSSMVELERSFTDCLIALEDAKFSLKSEWESQVMDSPSTFKDIIELMPVKIKDPNKSGNVKTNRFVYLRQSVISKDKSNKIKIQNIKASTKAGGSTKQGSESIIEKDKKGNISYNLKNLAKQLSTPEVKAKLFEFKADTPNGYLFGESVENWAKELEEVVSGSTDFGIIHVSGGAQFMRYATTAKLSGNFDPLKGQVSLKGELSGQVALAQGAVDASIFIPDRLGVRWELKGYDSNGNQVPYPLGNFRAKLAGYVSGFVGASACVCAQLSIQLIEQDGVKKQVLAGTKNGSKSPNLVERNQKGTNMYQQIKKEDAQGASVDASAFAGAKVAIGLSGSLQWLKPLAYYTEEEQKTLSNQLEFEDFAVASPEVNLMAGAGGGFSFYCQWHKGKILIKCHASLCVGVGAKGSLEFQIDVQLIFQFVRWFAHQLFWSNYNYLKFMEPETFDRLKYMMTMVIGFGEDAKELLNQPFQSLVDIYNDIKSSIESSINEVEERNQLAKRVLNSQQLILSSPPESKGMLIALLMQCNALDYKQLWWVPQMDMYSAGQQGIATAFYKTRCQAIITILHTIQTQREWLQVMKNIEIDTNKLKGTKTLADAIANEQKMTEFLSLDFHNYNKDIEVQRNSLINQQIFEQVNNMLTTLKTTIAQEPAYGCAVVPNNCPEYQLRAENDLVFPWRANLDQKKKGE